MCQVVTFENTDTWLRVLAAEKAGLIKVDLDFKTQQVCVLGGMGVRRVWGPAARHTNNIKGSCLAC